MNENVREYLTWSLFHLRTLLWDLNHINEETTRLKPDEIEQARADVTEAISRIKNPSNYSDMVGLSWQESGDALFERSLWRPLKLVSFDGKAQIEVRVEIVGWPRKYTMATKARGQKDFGEPRTMTPSEIVGYLSGFREQD